MLATKLSYIFKAVVFEQNLIQSLLFAKRADQNHQLQCIKVWQSILKRRRVRPPGDLREINGSIIQSIN